jgi:hypothetical protein
MKLTKAQIDAFEAEDREIIAQTESDFESGGLVRVKLSSRARSAIRAAAGEALKWLLHGF